MSGPDGTETFEISAEVAERYERKFVPALFAEWASDLLDAVALHPGQSVLDVACGTGIVARGAADLVGAGGRVVGLDSNPAMLTVARRIRPDVEWQHGDAADLPFADGTFDAVLCQSALMFFPWPARALAEMARVVTREGTVGVQVPGRLEASAGYVAFYDVVAQHAGADAVNLVSTYFAAGDPDKLAALVESAGLAVTALRTRIGHVRVDSIEEFVTTEIGSTPLVDRLSDDVVRKIVEGSNASLARFRTEDGRVAVPIEGHVITARRQ